MPENVIVVGAGLAGLAAAFELCKAGLSVRVLESRDVLGGRTSSWIQDGMPVESGLHKFLGIYRALPDLLKEVGVQLDDILEWVDELAFMDPHHPEAVFVPSPYHHPLQTAGSLLGNREFLPLLEKPKLAAMAAAGCAKAVSDPHGLDGQSIADYARQFGVSEDIVQRFVSTATQAVLFLPASEFSAYAVFAPTVEGLKHGMTFRLGAFKGGMTEVMIRPIVRGIEARNGSVRAGANVTGFVLEHGGVAGVRLSSGEVLRADATVLATPLNVAQRLLQDSSPGHPAFAAMLQLPTLSAATIQFELDAPLLSTDRTNFSSTEMCCFAEQSRTTFREVPGRLSAILHPAERFLPLPAEAVVERVCQAAESLGLPLRGHIRRYRIVNHPSDFYAMRPGSESLRPDQETPIPGLTLAGDYTKQPWSASMEGAVVSGQLAAAAVLER
jgi:15-cis-phytoene desaturase